MTSIRRGTARRLGLRQPVRRNTWPTDEEMAFRKAIHEVFTQPIIVPRLGRWVVAKPDPKAFRILDGGM